MGKFSIILVLLLVMDTWLGAESKRSFSLGRTGSKKNKSSLFGSGRRSSNNGDAPSAPPAPPAPKPAQTGSYGWSAPGSNNAKPSVNSHQPSSNIGPGGYPVQPGFQKSPPPYSPTNTHGTSINQGRVAPPAYSPTNPHINPPSYNSHYPKQTINNHYHYHGPPPAYSQPSHFGMSSAHYPPQNNFGYPGGMGGGFFGSKPKYGGMSLFSSGAGSYGYPGTGSWGGYPSYGSGKGNLAKGLVVGAVGGYLANSLIRKVTNPWGYGGYGYGHGYMDRYRDMGYYNRDQPTQAPQMADPSKDWINCVAYDPESKVTMINPNCSCTVTVSLDPTTGQNISHHDCTPFGQGTPPPQYQQPLQQPYGVNNPPPTFNGSMYGPGMAYGATFPVAPQYETQDVTTSKVEVSTSPTLEPPTADATEKLIDFSAG